MSEIITIELTNELSQELEDIVRSDNVSRNLIIQEALNNFLFIRKFKNLRAKMITEARSKGIETDDDIFKVIS